MKKEEMIDGCWYMVGLGMNQCNPQPLQYKKTDLPKHLVWFNPIAGNVHITRVQYILTEKEHPEYYL